MATASRNFRSESVTVAARSQSVTAVLGRTDVLMAKMLCARKASKSPRGVRDRKSVV